MNMQEKKFLFWFAHEHVNFRNAEMDSIISMLDVKIKFHLKPPESPYWIVGLPSEADVMKIASRSISLRFCLELWANSRDPNNLHEILGPYATNEVLAFKNKSFKIVVETFCKHFSQKEKIDKIEAFQYLSLKGPVKLKDPEVTFFYIEYYGLDPNSIPENPEELFFGRWIADGQRDHIKRLSLKTRKFIGNTSMDPQLSIIMANQARIKTGDIVLDPFVGSGSLLIAASHFGGYTFGTDIDYLMLHGRTRPTRISQKVREKDEGVATNMDQYGLDSCFLDVVVSDFSRPLWRTDFRIDAIITDPPYGIREATEKVGTAKENPVIEGHQNASHIPSKVTYDLCQIYYDLLNFSAVHLKMNGRVVCWYPLFRASYTEDQIPTHPCLELIANSEQILSSYTSRRLLTYSKIKEPKDTDVTDAMGIKDFREKYFNMRDEVRRVRRIREAEIRAKQKEMWEKKCKDNTER